MNRIVESILMCILYAGPTPRNDLRLAIGNFRDRYPWSYKMLVAKGAWGARLIKGIEDQLGD